MENLNYLVTQIAAQLSGTNADNGQQAAWWILESLTGKSKTALLMQKDFKLSAEQEEKLTDWLYKIKEEKYPLQYLLGFVPFLGLNILVETPILIPRPETEEWVDNLIASFDSPSSLRMTGKDLKDQSLFVLDIGVGTGCIGLAIAKAFPKWNVLGVDISDKALALAEKNKAENNLENINFIKSDLFECMPAKKFDLIVSNPPYISQKQYEQLEGSVALWEDRQALVASIDGLSVIKKIIAQAGAHLSKKYPNMPALVMEVDYTHAAPVTDLLDKAGFSKVEVHKDFAGKDRVVYAYV